MDVMFLCDSLYDTIHHQEDFQHRAIYIRGSNSNMFKNQSHHQEDSKHHKFQGCSGAVGVFYFERHTYNYSDNGEWALISPKLETGTIILGQREYLTKGTCKSKNSHVLQGSYISSCNYLQNIK